jgi:hypothetical protein
MPFAPETLCECQGNPAKGPSLPSFSMQAGARLVSRSPTPRTEPLSVILYVYARSRSLATQLLVGIKAFADQFGPVWSCFAGLATWREDHTPRGLAKRSCISLQPCCRSLWRLQRASNYNRLRASAVTIFVAAINGRGIAALHAGSDHDAAHFVRDYIFRDDLTTLMSRWSTNLGWSRSCRGSPSILRRGSRMARIAG